MKYKYDLCDSTKFCKSYLHVHLNTMHLSIQQKCTHRKFSPTNNITKISITSSQSQLMIRNFCGFNRKIGNEKVSDREDNEMENIRSDWKWKKSLYFWIWTMTLEQNRSLILAEHLTNTNENRYWMNHEDNERWNKTFHWIMERFQITNYDPIYDYEIVRYWQKSKSSLSTKYRIHIWHITWKTWALEAPYCLWIDNTEM